MFNHASPQPIEMLFTPFVSEYLCNRPSSRPKISTTIELPTTTDAYVVFRFEAGTGLMSVWLLQRVCDTWPGAGEGRKKDYLEVKRASYYHVKQG